MSSVPAVPEQPGGVTSAVDELTACLEVLADVLGRSDLVSPFDGQGEPVLMTQLGSREGHAEWLAAMAQVCELVPLLIEENNQAWDVIDGLKEMALAQAASRHMNRAQRRALRRTSGGILLPE